MHSIVLIHFAATWAMVGLIWFVQLVHYPLFSEVGATEFHQYERRHCQRITWLVGPLMTTELVTAAWLAVAPPSSASATVAWIGAALVVVIWSSTALVQVPLHAKLGQGFDPLVARRLTATNWLRTIAWTVRGFIAAALLAR